MSDAGRPCFLENLRLFSNAKTEPERFNLYSGLVALSDTVASLTHTIRNIDLQLDSIVRKIDDLSK